LLKIEPKGFLIEKKTKLKPTPEELLNKFKMSKPGLPKVLVHGRPLDQGRFVGLAYQGKDIVFSFIIEYSSLRDFGP
jgi:hypothetical protein